jgi:hypothetical protein
MFISGTGKIYLINNNMQVVFTGAITQNKDTFNSLVDGENVLHGPIQGQPRRLIVAEHDKN